MPDLSFIDHEFLYYECFLPFCIITLSISVGAFVNRFINNTLANRLNVNTDAWYYIIINALKGAPISLSAAIGASITVTVINIPEGLERAFSCLLFTSIAYTITRTLARAATGLINYQLESGGGIMLPKTSLLNNLVNIAIYALGILIVLQYYGISIAPILTAMGVGGMALALGMQETIANIFSGLHLIISKQVRIGDYIQLANKNEGKVTDITWRFTTIESPVGNVIVIPNKSIASAEIVNYSMPRRDITIKVHVGVSYDSDLEQVERVTLEVANKVRDAVGANNELVPSVVFTEFGDSSINFDVCLHADDFKQQYTMRSEFIKELTARYRKEGIDIPYPIRTVLRKDN